MRVAPCRRDVGSCFERKTRRTVPLSGRPMLGTRRLWPLIWSERAWWHRTTAPRSTGSSPLTIFTFQTAGRCAPILRPMIHYFGLRSTSLQLSGGMWCVYRLAGGTATDILVHFPASFSSWLNDILRLSIASRRIASSFCSLSSGT